MATASNEGWKNYGLLRVPGLPAPTGQYAVGVVDLMHDGLLVRLYYPTDPKEAVNYEYSHHGFRGTTYTKAFFQAYDYSFPGLLSGAMKLFVSPRLPAVVNPPLLTSSSSVSQDGTLPTTHTTQDGEDTINTPATQNGHEDEEQKVTDSPPPVQFPIIVFSHGLSGNFFSNNAVCYDLASHGYVVASVEHKDGSSCIALKRVPGRGVQEGDYDRYIDEWIPFNKVGNISLARGDLIKENQSTFHVRNTQVKTRANEVGEVYDLLKLLNEGGTIKNMLGGSSFDFSQFKGRLNMDQATVIGHSFGGGTAVQTLYQDDRFKYGIALDSWLFPIDEEVLTNGISQSLVFINVDTFQWPKNIERMMRLIQHEKGNISMYTLKGAVHISQTDGPFLMIPGVSSVFKTSETNMYTLHNVNMELCHGFLKRYLHQDPEYCTTVPLLDGGEGSSEYFIYGTNINWKEALPDREVDPTGLEPAELEPETIPEPEMIQEPKPEPEMIQEPETIQEPEIIQEPETIQESKTIPEPETMPEPETIQEPETMQEPEAMPEPEAIPETENKLEPENKSEGALPEPDSELKVEESLTESK